MKVGFLNNQIDNRGTGNALFEYAHYNESLLGNQSLIFTLSADKPNPQMLKSLLDRFGRVVLVSRPDAIANVDVLYHIKYGNNDELNSQTGVCYAVHSVFCNEPHGDRYATVSRWLSGDSGVPYVPHIVKLPEATFNLKRSLGIPQTAIVFGRYGGYDTFDISWVWDVIEKILAKHNNTWFLFANTQPFVKHERIIYLDELTSPVDKTNFIVATDYMLHARHRGETFGISVGEFASEGRPVITYTLSGEKAHIDILESGKRHSNAPNYYGYEDQFDLYDVLTQLSSNRLRQTEYSYREFTPEKVMQKFKEVFLS